MYPMYDKIEELASSSEAAIFGKAMHKTLDNLVIYNEWMVEETEATDISIEGRSGYVSTALDRMASIQSVLDNPNFSEATRQKWEKKLDELKEQNTQLDMEKENRENELELQTQLLEQRAVTEDTIQELRHVVKKHVGHSRRIILEALQDSGVDIRIYFSGVMDGNHCMRFSEFGEKIMKKITKNMLELDGIKGNENLTVVMNKHHCLMTKILSL